MVVKCAWIYFVVVLVRELAAYVVELEKLKTP